MTTLYELREVRDLIDDMLAATEGEVTPQLEAMLTELDTAIDEKIERVGLYIREQRAQVEAIQIEIDRLASRAAQLNRAADGLTRYLQSEMERLGKMRVNGLLCTVAMQNNPPSVKGDISADELRSWWRAEGDDRAGFIRYTPEQFALDKRVVLSAHKQGLKIPEGLTVEQTRSVRIK